MAPLSHDTSLSAGVAVVALAGELDLAGAAKLEHEIDRLAASGDASTVILDLRGLEFMDSSGLRLVALTDRKMTDAGGRLVLVRGIETVQRVFDITRMTERLTFVDRPEALAGGEPEPV